MSGPKGAIHSQKNLKEEDHEEEEEEGEDSAEIARQFVKGLAPDIRQRVFGLQGIQKDHAKVHEACSAELRELEQRYEALYAPLFEKRKQIVTGAVEPTEDEVAAGSKVMEVKDADDEEEEAKKEPVEGELKGIPDFWLTALKNNELTGDLIEQRDEDCLKSLRDITAKNFEDPNRGFKITFHFSENAYFTNEALTKTYFLVDEDEILLESTEGCDIEWKAGQKLTVIMKKKKQKQKGGKNTRTVTKEEPCPSFFGFFKPMDEESLAAEYGDADDLNYDDMENEIETDYEIGRAIKDKLIPRGVDWYTGEAIVTMSLEDLLGAQGRGGDDEDEDEDGAAATIAAGGDPKAPECKQQ